MSISAYTVDLARVFISLAMLGYASYRDFETREIHDIVWIIPAGCGLILDSYEYINGNLTGTGFIINVGFMVLLSGILWFLNLFGEADLIAFIALAIIHPRVPEFSFIGFPPLLFSFTLISNSAISGLLMALYTFARNIYTGKRGVSLFDRHEEVSPFKKIAIMFTGRKMPIKAVRGPPFEYPLEGRGKLILQPNLFDDKKARKVFRELRERNVEWVWVSATLPYIVVLLVGYLLSIVLGDLMFTFMSYLY